MNVFLFLGLAAVALLAWTFLPYYWHYLKMQEVTKSTVLEWDAWDNEARAKDKLSDLLAFAAHHTGLQTPQ